MSQRRLSVTILIADLVWSSLAMIVAYFLRYGARWAPAERNSALHLLPFLFAVWIVWSILSGLLPLDGFRRGWRLSAVVSQLLLAVGILLLILLSCGYLARSYVSRIALVNFCILLFPGFVLIRAFTHSLLRARSENGAANRVVIVGGGHLARELRRKIQQHPEMLCRVVGFLAPDNGQSDGGLSVDDPVGTLKTGAVGAVDMLLAQSVDEVILVLEECASPDLLNLAALCRDRGLKVSFVPQFYELYLSRSRLNDLGGLPVLQLARPGLPIPVLIGKRILDLALGTVLGVLSIPLLLSFAVPLRRVKGKAFRWETRCGLHGKPFAMLRLNVDRADAKGTWFQSFLCDFSITELPQLWNVLHGEMSLVGPRPESRDRVCRYSDWQQQRLAVKPGMTGLAQVQGLREQHSSEEKTRFDLQYLLACSPWTDLTILLQTVWTLATRFSIGGRPANRIAPVGSLHTGTRPAEEDVLEHAHRS